ncbi:autotransporter-associated beta strand repeat-containing protein [Prosthecobacter dejongeii]|uniref:Autotransporter-associated beta strand protein n=1 Tax=Prosthecobacter dejongeii TaxID=48465 RepID=A0A7W8DR38_9BACT|nr:autotransporter-associated beta strand repeat-containing protein [Prosthecobacter dejongeii]MBB5038870.1 autotransporter-associated beta strand protein [Prosthecobacter dejongeii]
MKKSHPQLNISEQMMHTMRHRLRLPVTVLMLACNLCWTLQSNGEVLVKSNSGSNTFLSPTVVLPVAHYANNAEPTASDILLFKNDITAASTFRVSSIANSILSIQGLQIWNPAGALTIQNNASQNQTLRIGSAGIDMSRATQNLVINNNTGGVLTLALDSAAAATWSVAQGRTLQVTSNITGTNTGLTINPGLNGLGGTVNLGGANTFTGATTVNNSALILDYTSAANRIASGSSLNLNRGAVTVQGSATFTQAVTGLNLGSGLNQIIRGGTTASLNVGAITRSSPAALLNIGAAGFVTTSQANTNGILGGWAVVNNTDWAVGNGASTITALATYVDRTGAWTAPLATDNVRVTGAVTAATTGTINSLKFNTGAFNLTQNAGTTLNIASGGILKNDNNATTISGGSLTAGGTANGTADSLYIWQSQNTMTISSNIVNNGADVVNLVKAGASDLVLSGTASTYTGTTTVANGRLTIGNAGAINKAGNIEIYGNSGADNTGSLRWNTTTTDTITGNITGAAGTDALRHTLQKLNTGVLILNPTVANTYFGSTLIDAGTLRAGKAGAFSANSRFQFANVATAILDLAGFNNTIRGLAGGGTTGGSVSLGSGTLTLQNLENDALSYAGVISGTGGVIKEGAGTQTFTTNQTFTGPLSVNEGLLSTSGLATTNVTVQAGGILQPANLTAATTITIQGNGMLQMKVGGSLNASPSVSLNGQGSTLQLATGVTQSFNSFTSAEGSRLVMTSGVADTNLTFIDNGGATNIIRGVIGMSGTTGAGKGNIIKAGSNNWELAGGNAYNGSTTVNGGDLIISSSALVEVLPDLTALTLANTSGVDFILNGKTETIGSLSGGGGTGGNVNLGAGRLTVGGNGTSTTYAGAISGAGSLVKTGNGVMTLSGANTFTGGLEINRGTLVLDRTGGNTLASTLPVTLSGLNARLEVNASQSLGSLNSGPGTTVKVASGATLTTTQSASGSVFISGAGDTDTRVIQLGSIDAAANLRVGMSVTGAGLPAGVYITQILAGDQILVNRTLGADFSNQLLTFGTAGEMSGVLEGEGNWTKAGTGRTVLAANNTLSGTMTISEGTLQVGGVTTGGRNWTQDIVGDQASLVFSDTNSTTLNFADNVAAALIYERIGSIGGGVSATNISTINLSGTNVHALLAVGGNNTTSTFKGTILGDAASVFVKEGDGKLTWQSDRTGSMRGTIRVESGGLAITGTEGLNSAARVAISNKPGAYLELNANVSQTVTSLVGGGRGAVTTYANGTLGALGGAYLGATGGEVRLTDAITTDQSIPNLTLDSPTANAVFRFGGAVTGTGNLVKGGANTLELLGDNTYSGFTSVEAAAAANTTNTLRLGAYGTSSGVGSLASGGYGSLPSTTALNLVAGNGGAANRSVVFDLNGASQTLASLSTSFEGGGRTVFMRGGSLTINTQPGGVSGTFSGIFDGLGTINVQATQNQVSSTDGWILTGDNNLNQTGSLNISGGKVTLNRVDGTLGDRLNVTVTGTGELFARESDVIGSLSGNGTVTIASGHTLTLSAAPVGGVAENAWSGNITGLGGLTLAPGGSIRLTTPQSYLGNTTLNTNSALYLDYGTTAQDLLPGALVLNGGNIFLSGSTGQTIASTTIGSGVTSISTQLNAPAARLQLNAINRDTLTLPSGINPGSGGGVLQIRGASASTSVTAQNGILGGYATYHAVDANGNPVVTWAKPNGANVPINGYTAYTTDFALANNNNMDVNLANAEFAVAGTIGSLRFNAPALVDLFIGGESGTAATRIQSGGILITPNVGPNNVSITGLEASASITGGDSGFRVRRELIVHQHNTRGTFTINAPIVDNVQATRLTKVGQGTLILTQPNSYSGQTSILAGVLELASAEGGGQGSLGNISGSFAIQNFGYLSFNRAGANDTYEVINDIIGTGALRKMNTGTVILRGSNSTYTGPTQVLGGKLSVGSDRALGSTSGLTSVAPSGILELRGINSPESVVLEGGTLSSAIGASTLSGSLTLTSSSTLVAPDSNSDLVLAGLVTAYPGSTLTISGNGSTGGKVILTNANNQIGNVNVNANTSLQVGNNTPGWVGRGVITTNAASSGVITNTNNSQLVFGTKITGSGNYTQARNTVFLTQDNDYTGTTTVGGNGVVGVLNSVANLRVGMDTYTGSIGTGSVTIQAGNGGDSWLRYHLLKSVQIANNITINPFLEGATPRAAGFNRFSLGSIELKGSITAGPHGIGTQRAFLQTEGGGKMTVAGVINDGETNALNIVNNGFMVFANSNAAHSQDLWGVISGGGNYTFRSAGTITLKGINTFNSSNFIRSGTVIVDNAPAVGQTLGLGLNDDNDFYLARGAELQFNYDEITGALGLLSGSTVRLNNGAALTLDDAVAMGSYGNFTGDGTLNLTANGGAAWLGLFGTNDLSTAANIGSTNQQTTVRINSLPATGTAGSLGTNYNVNLGVAGGTGETRLEYMGPGESTDRGINLSGGASVVRIAGSGKGALILDGPISITSPGNKTLHLQGQTIGNTVNGMIDESSNVISLVVNQAAGNTDMNGLGRWILTNAANNFSGNVTVDLGVLELAGNLGSGNAASSVFGDMTTTRVISLGTGNFDGRKFDVFGGGDNLGAASGLGSTGSIVFNDPNVGTATFGTNIRFVQPYNSTTNPGNGELVNNGNKVLVFNGTFTAGDSGNRNWILDGTNTGTNTINGVISDTLTTGGNTVGILKEGPGTWRLAGANTYEGTTTVARGVLELSGGLAVFDNGIINLSNAGSDGSSVGGATVRVLQSETIGGLQGNVGTTVDIAAGQLLTVRNATQTYNGQVTGNGGFVRTNNDGNARDTTFTNLNTYAGPTRIINNVTNQVSNRINIFFLANGGQASGIGAASSSASNLVLDNGTGGGGLRWLGSNNQSTDRLFTLGAGAGAGAIWGDGQVFGDFAPAMSFTNPGAIAFVTSNTNQTLTLRGGTVSDNTFAPLLSNNGTGITSLSKVDGGMWVLTNANTYTGTTTISGGTLAITNSAALGTGAISLAGGAGTGLQLRGGLTITQGLTNTVSDGTLVAASGINTWNGAMALGGSNANFRVGVNEGATLNITSAITGSVGTSRLIKFDRGTLMFSGNNTFTGTTNVAGGTLILNYDTTAGGTNSSKLADASGSNLELGFSGASGSAGITTGLGADNDVGGQTYQPAFAGGTLVLSGGSHTEIVAATTLNNGANRVIRNGGTSVLQMGLITRAAANNINEFGTIDFSAAGIATTSTVNSSGGILANTGTNTLSGAYATIDRTNWAVSAASGTNILINALASYSANTFAANANTDITSASVNAAANATTHTLRFNTNNGGTTTLNLAGILSLETGGILVTKNITDNIVIDGSAGSLRRSGNTAGLDTIIHHYGSGLLTINAVIANNTNAQALTKTGTGTLVLNAANSYTGRVNIQQGIVQVGDGTAATSAARLGGGNNALSMADGATLRLNVANSNLEFALGTMSGGGTLHLAATNQSILNLSADNGNWVGDILVQGGVLRIRGNNNALGNLRGITTIESGGRLDINGSNQSFAERITFKEGALFTVTNNGATNSSATISGILTLQNTTTAGLAVNVGTSQALTLTGLIRGSNGFTKTGNGILNLSANQMQDLLPGTTPGTSVPNTNPALLGQVIIAGGEVRLGNARALGATGVGNETIVQSGASLDLRGQALNFADDPSLTREVIRVNGAGFNNLGALKNTSGLGVVSSVVFDGNTTLSGGGFVNSSRLVVAPFDTNENVGSNFAGNLTRTQSVIDGKNADLVILGSSTANDANGVGVTFRDPNFTSALNSINVREGTFRIEQEAGSNANFNGLTTSNVTNGITVGYGGATLADHTNSSLGVGPNVGARLNFYRNWNTSHSVNITLDGELAKTNLGVNYIDMGNDATIPNPRTYLTGTITLKGDADRNVFHIDASAIQQTLGEQGNLTGTIQSKLVINGPLVGTGGFTKTGARELRLTANNTFSGNVNVLRFITAAVAWQDNLQNINGVDYQTLGDAEAWAEWGVTLSGSNGRLSGTQNINLQRRGLITLDNTNRLDASSGAGVVGGNNNDRINNSASINFDHGWLKLIGGTSNNSESLATLDGAKINVRSGSNIFDIMPTDGANTAINLTIGEITRSSGAVLQFNNLDSTSKFGTTTGPESVRITLNTLGTLAQSGDSNSSTASVTDKNVVIGLLGGIMPHQYLSDVRQFGYNNASASDYYNQGRNQQFITASHFMTYDSVTKILRPLDDSEYYTPTNGLLDNTPNGSLNQNVNLSDAFAIVRDNTSINSLRFGPLADNNGDGLTGTPINDRTTLTSVIDAHVLQLYVDGTLNINSGMISSGYFTTGNNQNNGTHTLIAGGTLNFGNREAIINNQNAIIRSTDGVVATGNLEIRSGIAGSGGLLKTGIAQVVLDGRNTYSGITTVSNGSLFLRSGRQALGAGGAGNGVVIEGIGTLNSGGGIQVGTPTAYENFLVKALQANQYVMRVDNDLTNWYSNLIIDNVDAAGQVLFTPLVRTDNAATAIINGNIYGGATAVTNDVLAIDSRIVQFEAAGNNVYHFRGQFGDRGDANGNALPIADRISTLPTVAGTRTNENEVLRVNFSGAGDSNFVMDKQYNAAGRLTVIQGNVLVNYDPADPTLDGSGFYTNSAISKIPNADSNTTTFAVNGGTTQQGFVLGTTANNGTSSLFLTKPGQVFNMASWTATGSGLKWVGGLNESGEVRYGSSTATGNLSIGSIALRLYSAAGGTVVFDQRLTGNPGTFPDNLSFLKVGRGTVVLQNSTNATASDSSFEIAGGTLVLDHSGQNVARVGTLNARFSGGVVHAQSNLAAATTIGYASNSGADNTLQLRPGSTELIAEGRGTRVMTVNVGNTNANNNRSNLTRDVGSTLNFVEAITGNGNGIINLNFNNFANAAVRNRIISWATYGNTAREALDFAMADSGAGNRVKAINRVAGEYLNDVSAWQTGMDVSENGAAGFFGALTGTKILNTVRFDTAADSLVTIGGGQALTLSGDGIAGGILVSSNTGSSNKTINGGSINAFNANYTGGTTVNSNVITNVSSTANLTVGMPVTGSGIPAGTFITAIIGNSITLSANATATNASVALNTATPEIILHQYGKGTLNIGSTISEATPSSTTNLTIAGPATTAPGQFGTTGVVKLTGNNTYRGSTYVNGAVLEISDTSALGVNPSSLTNSRLVLNGGSLRWTGGIGSLDNRGVALHGGGGVIDVVNSYGNLVIGHELASTQGALISQEIFRGDLIKMGAGSLTLLGNNATFQGLMDVREGSLVVMADTGNAGTGTTTVLGSNRSWADGTILRSGANLQAFLGNGNNGGDWNIDEFFTFEGNNTFTYGGLLDINAPIAATLNSSQFNLGVRRPLNLNGVLDVKGTTTFDVVPSSVLRLNNGSGYLTGSGDIVKDGQGRLEFRANVPDWTGNLVIKQGLVYAANQADVLGRGYASGKTITLGSTDRQGTAELLILSPDTNNQGWEFDINHDIDVVYNPAQTKRLGIDGIANGNLVSYNGDITLNDSLILLIRDTNNATGGEQSYVNFNGNFRDGTTTSGNLVIQTDDADGGLNGSPNLVRGYGYAVLNGDNSAWTGDITIGTNASYNHDNTAILRFGNQKALTAANDVTMSFNSILQAGGQNVTIGNLTTQGGVGAFYGDVGTASTTSVGSSEIIENASATAATLTISQTTPVSYEASWDAFIRDGTLNSLFFAPGANTQQKSAALSITKAGNGWATLSLDNDYSGTTTVQAGILQVGRNGIGDTGTSPTAGNALTLMTQVLNGGTIAGTGIIQGKLTVAAGGTLKAGDMGGNTIGTLAVSGDAIFASGSNALFQLRNATYNNPGALTATDTNYGFWRDNVVTDQFSSALNNLVTTAQHDMLTATGSINWAPGMKITVQNDGYTPKAGDVFRLFKGAGYVGDINVGPVLRSGGESELLGLDLILFALGGNLLWDVSLFNDYGIVMVVESDTAVQSISPPIITQQPQTNQSQTVKLAPGTLVTLSALATTDGAPENLRYQWLLNGLPVNAPGSTSPTFTFPASFNSKGVYRLAVTNEGGTTLSSVNNLITVMVEDVPDITFNNVVAPVAPGGSRTFSVTVSGEATKPNGQPGFDYQWYKDDVAIEGANSESLALTNIDEEDEGYYYVVVTNIAGSDTSAEAFLDVVDPISNVVVTVSPADTYVGQDIRFDVTHLGGGTLTYQWKRNGFNIPNETRSFLTLPNAQLISEGNYTVTITSTVGGSVASTATSTPVQLTLQAPQPEIRTAPRSQTVLAGQPLDLKVIARGRPVLRYAWKRNNVVVANATSADISTAVSTVAQGGTYIVEVSNSVGKTSNAIAPLTPAEVVVVDSGSRYLPVGVGAPATFTALVGAGPKTPLTYKWKRYSTRTVVIGPGPDEVEGTEDDEMGPEEYEVLTFPAGTTGIETRVMKIAKAAVADSDIYRCEISGPVGPPVIGSEYDLRVFTEAPQFVGGATTINFDTGLIGRDYDFTVPVNRADEAKSPDKITATGLPPGLKIDPISGRITGKPTATKVGGYNVVVTLANKIGKVTATGTIVVNDLMLTIPGAWVGLVDRHPVLGAGLGGRVELTVTTKATYTGKLILGATTYSFSGPLNVNGAAPTGSVFIKRTGNPLPDPLRLDFVLDPANNTITEGTITDGSSTVGFDGWRQIFSKTVPASTYTGYYTMALGLSDDSPLMNENGSATVPLGAGYAAFTVAADGKLSMVGKMADGEAFTNATFVGPDGELAVFQYQYKALKPGGSVLGQFRIDDKDDTDLLNSNNTLDGSATWVRPASTKVTDRTFRAGFGVASAPVSTPVPIVAIGGRYDAPAAGKVVLDIPEPLVPVNNASIDFFNGGDLNYAYTSFGQNYVSMNPDVNVAVIKGSKVTILKENVAANVTKTAMTAVPKTGLLSGSFTTKDFNPRFPLKPDFITRAVKFQGVIIREEGQLIGVGYFLLPQLPNQAAGTTDKTSPFYSGRFVFEPLQ